MSMSPGKEFSIQKDIPCTQTDTQSQTQVFSIRADFHSTHLYTTSSHILHGLKSITVYRLAVRHPGCRPPSFTQLTVLSITVHCLQVSGGVTFNVRVALDTDAELAYMRHGGVLNYNLCRVLRHPAGHRNAACDVITQPAT